MHDTCVLVFGLFWLDGPYDACYFADQVALLLGRDRVFGVDDRAIDVLKHRMILLDEAHGDYAIGVTRAGPFALRDPGIEGLAVDAEGIGDLGLGEV